MNRTHTNTQLKKACGLRHQQDVEFDAWLAKQNITTIKNASEYAEWDTVGQRQRLWDQYQRGTGPWDLIMYFNNTKIVELGELCRHIDGMLDQLTDGGQIYMALNKWCVRVDLTDDSLLHLDFDTALPIYINHKLKNFTVDKYTYMPADRGGIGNWVHGNNRFWLIKK
jgi:hypothetical protein